MLKTSLTEKGRGWNNMGNEVKEHVIPDYDGLLDFMAQKYGDAYEYSFDEMDDPHAIISSGKKGYTIVLRTGPNMPECEKIIGSIEHFYGHLEIECKGHLGLTSIEYKTDVEPRKQEIIDFCKNI